ncbi:relaxase/mobilization nuclease domain-containing protein [Leisingera aquaemixtae]|uniref:relaxase/mobilization nuclease domain-containing protein n=1 Tax=Leisingera aquaemixtae TaxID=1396826 RepID=UPI003984449D
MAGGRGEVLQMRNLASAEPREAAREMQVAARVSIRCRRPVMHITVSYDPADKTPTNAEMQADAAEVLGALGLADNQALVIKHSDRDHAHFHIAANRVGGNGKAVSDSQSYPRTETALRRIEARRGLSVTEGRHAPASGSGKRMTGHRCTPDTRQHRAPESVRQALLTAQSWDGLRRELEGGGWKLETVQRGRRPAGAILVGPEGQRIAAGKIDRRVTMSKLCARLESEQSSETAAQAASPRTTGKKPLALAKHHGDRKRKKPKADQRVKKVAKIGAEITTELVGAITKTAAPRVGQIGATRKSTSAPRKKRRPSTRLGM